MTCSSCGEKVIAVIYGHPDGSKIEFRNFYEELLEFLRQLNAPLIIMRDVNLDTSLVKVCASEFNKI